MDTIVLMRLSFWLQHHRLPLVCVDLYRQCHACVSTFWSCDEYGIGYTYTWHEQIRSDDWFLSLVRVISFPHLFHSAGVTVSFSSIVDYIYIIHRGGQSELLSVFGWFCFRFLEFFEQLTLFLTLVFSAVSIVSIK